MIAFLKKYKGYFIHAAAVGVVFLDPSVKAFLAQHSKDSEALLLGWGFILHYVNGK